MRLFLICFFLLHALISYLPKKIRPESFYHPFHQLARLRYSFRSSFSFQDFYEHLIIDARIRFYHVCPYNKYLILKLLVCILSNALSQRVQTCTSTGTKYVRVRTRLPSRTNS